MTEPEFPLAAQFRERREELERALAYTGGTHTLDDVWQGVIEGKFQLWIFPESIAITEVLEYPRCRSLHVFLAAGRMQELEALYPVLLTWAMKMGCDRMSVSGRPGWARSFLAKDGWQTSHIVITKALE